ncbi:hypothetical protein [Deinococcus kurensis]|uniref:hypothetical protein n=1 Tax=Deinococcus kurensis TaxID=2662757 RepID=UPI0012D2A245|nr:hypothetical protein [Deinococcus kurensis]
MKAVGIKVLRAALLPLLLLTSAQAGGAAEPAWIGRAVEIPATPLCQALRCTLQTVRVNTPDTMGWHDGQQRTYRTATGWRLEVDVRPGGQVSGARLLRPGAPRGTRLTDAQTREAAAFLSALTGRAFRPQAVRACFTAGLAAQARDFDAYGPADPLSDWSTPGGWTFRARCGVAGAGPLGVWAGWMQG